VCSLYKALIDNVFSGLTYGARQAEALQGDDQPPTRVRPASTETEFRRGWKGVMVVVPGFSERQQRQ